VLKKAGIVVAAAAAGLLAVSPLAFAGDKGDDWGHHHGGDHAVNSVSDDSETVGLVNVTDNEVNVPVQACNNDVSVAVIGGAANDVTGALSGAASLFGDAEAESEATDNEVRECDQENTSGGVIDQEIG
jgi:hypothetical protein